MTDVPRVRRFLFINRRAPHGSVYALEGLEAVLAASAFEQAVSVLFMDDGVFQLRRDQDTSGAGTRNFSRTFKALEMYGVEDLYVDEGSLERRGMGPADLLVPVIVLDSDQVGELIDGHDVLMNF